MDTFSEIVRAQRAERRLTLAQLAEQTGYKESHLSLVERGLRRLPPEGVVRVARALQLDPAQSLLAAVRERLPEQLRSLVPTEISSAPENSQSLVRQFQARHTDYEIEELRIEGQVDWDGNVRKRTIYEGCRPNASGRPVWQLSFQERANGLEPESSSALPKLAVTKAPGQLEIEPSTIRAGTALVHRVFFPKGWRRTGRKVDDSLSLEFETFAPRVFAVDPGEDTGTGKAREEMPGRFSISLSRFVKRLVIQFDFPRPYVPWSWEAWAWWGNDVWDFATRNLVDAGICRQIELHTEGGHAELVVEEPLAGFTFAVGWRSADRRTYLEARYGDPDAKRVEANRDPAGPPANGRSGRD